MPIVASSPPFGRRWGASTVVTVGAGTRSYEARERKVIAVEVSELMIAHRPQAVAPAVWASAEALPLAERPHRGSTG